MDLLRPHRSSVVAALSLLLAAWADLSLTGASGANTPSGFLVLSVQVHDWSMASCTEGTHPSEAIAPSKSCPSRTCLPPETRLPDLRFLHFASSCFPSASRPPGTPRRFPCSYVWASFLQACSPPHFPPVQALPSSPCGWSPAAAAAAASYHLPTRPPPAAVVDGAPCSRSGGRRGAEWQPSPPPPREWCGVPVWHCRQPPWSPRLERSSSMPSVSSAMRVRRPGFSFWVSHGDAAGSSCCW